MRGPSFDELFERGEQFRSKYKLRKFNQAVNIWHDCVGHSLFYQFTPASLEGEFLSGRHQHLVACGNVNEVIQAAPAKFDIHLGKVDLQEDPEALACRDKVLATLEDYLAELPQFENLQDYDNPFWAYLKKVKKLP